MPQTAEEKEQRRGVGEAGRGVALVHDRTGQPRRRGAGRGHEREDAADPEAERLEVGPQRAGQEGETERLPPVGGQEVAPMGVDRGPYLIGHGQSHGNAELGVGDGAADEERHHTDAGQREGPPALGRSAPSRGEPCRHQKGPDRAGIAGRRAVEVAAQDEQPAGHDPSPGRVLQHPQQAEHAADGERDAPGKVLVVDERRGAQVEDHRAAHDGGHQGPERRRLRPPDDGPTPYEDAEAPQHQRGHQGRRHPRQEDRGCGHLAVQAAGHQQHGHAEKGGEDTEVGVVAAVVHEGLDAHLPAGQVEVTVEHGPGLQIVEVVVGHAPERVHRARPQVPHQPQQQWQHRHRTDQDRHGEPPTALFLRRAGRGGLRAGQRRRRPRGHPAPG